MKRIESLFIVVVAFLALGIASPQDPAAISKKAEDQTPVTKGAHDRANAHYLDMSISELMQILNDPENRISEQFEIPEEAKPIVGFWFKIYSKYSLFHTVIYDRDHHDKVYEVVDSRDLFQRGLSPIALEITNRNRVQKALSGYKAALKVLQRNPRAKFATGSPGNRLVELWGVRKPQEWRKIEEAVRTQAGQRNKVIDGLMNADRFFPAMESIFRKYGIPTEITRLPLVESSFNLNAVSKADAVGVWQFLYKSATEYLIVDKAHKIDERLSPIKSTYAAARMFKRNYFILKDWGLAIIAYNHGAKNLIPIRKKFSGQQIASLLRETTKTPLGYASRSFYAEFLAILHAEKYRDIIYGMKRRSYSDAISIVKMKKPASIFEIATLYNISIHELRVFNPDIFDLNKQLPAGTRVVLPRKHGESLVLAPRLAPSPMPHNEAGRGIASEVEFIEYVK